MRDERPHAITSSHQATKMKNKTKQKEATGRLVAVVELCMRAPDGNLISSIKGPSMRWVRACRGVGYRKDRPTVEQPSH